HGSGLVRAGDAHAGGVRRSHRQGPEGLDQCGARDRRADQILKKRRMSLPQTNFKPPFNITRASHLVFTSRDLAKSRDFYTEVIGLKVSDETATTIHLRGVEERAHHSLTLKRT